MFQNAFTLNCQGDGVVGQALPVGSHRCPVNIGLDALPIRPSDADLCGSGIPTFRRIPIQVWRMLRTLAS